jgi:WD40 repeat protein/serine/threonine protein kinase
MHDPSISNPAYQSLTDQQLSEIDALCDRFDQELVSGLAPRIEIFLAEAPEAAQDGLLAELLAMEFEYRTQRGDEPQQDEYVQRFPEHESVIAGVFAPDATTHFSGNNRTSIPVDVPHDLGNFRLIKVIGRGGMGVVWLAEQVEPVKRRVAIKLIKSELTAKDVIARFDAEKQTLAMMDHPNIARVLDAGTSDHGHPYFVMELVDGVSITQYCDDNKLSVDERLKLFVPVCKAVQHAHQKGIVHRDLKPSNVLVTVVDGEAVPKVIDFGLAKAVEQHLLLTDLTMQTEFGKVVGTVQYMSPEQAELKGPDAEDIDTRTDIYSLGVMLYELLTGSTPLDAETLGHNALLRILQIIREDDPPRPSHRLSSSSNELNSAVGELRRLNPARLQQLLRGELDWVVMMALEKDRTRRYQTANDLARDLASYLAGETVTARPQSTWYQVQKFARRNRGLVAALFAIGVALLAGIAGTSYGLYRATEKTKLAEVKTREADDERGKANTSKQRALLEKSKAQSNEQRAIGAEAQAQADAQRARDSEASATFQLAVARYDADRAAEARSLLQQVPLEYRDNFEWHYCKRRFQGSDITCYGHTRGVYDVTFDPNGARIASAGGDETIRLWDAVTGKELTKLTGHTGRVISLEFGPDGSMMASAGDDKTIKLWDPNTGQEIRSLSGHSASVNCVAFAPGGDRLASASDDATVKLWDVAAGKEVRTLTGHVGPVSGIGFSPDGKWLASVGDDRLIRIWDPQSGERITELRTHGIDIRSVAFSPDGSRLIATSYNYVSIWDTQTWQFITESGKHDGYVHCVAISPDGTQFATGGTHTKIKLWDTRSGMLIRTLSGHANEVRGVAFSPDGSRLVSGSLDQTVKMWNVRGGNEITLPGPQMAHCVAFSSDGRQLASGADYGKIFLRNAKSGALLFSLKGHTDAVGDLSFSPDGTRLASAADDHTVRLWNTETGEELAVLKGHSSWVREVAFSPDGTQIASAGWDGTLKLWDAKTHQETATLKGHRGGLYCVAFSPDGSRLASASSDKTIKLWNAQSGEEIRTLTLSPAMARSVAFGPRGEQIVSGGYDPKVRVWEVATGKQITTANSPGAVFTVAFSSDGERIAAAGPDQVVKLFDARTGKEIMTLYPGDGGVAEVTFSSDSKRLASASHTGDVWIWDAPREHETTILSGQRDSVTSVTFSPDGSRIYSESENEKRVWDVAAHETIPDAMWEPPEVPTQTSADGRWYVTTELKNVVLVDLEYKNTPDEKGYQKAKTIFDPFWHEEQASAATTAENWYAAVFHQAWLLRHDPDSMAHRVGLQSSYRRLIAKDSGEVESLSRLEDVTSHHHGTFYTQQKKRIVTTFPATPFKPTAESTKSMAATSDSNHALYFDGTCHVDLGHPGFCKASFTVEGWIKRDVTEFGLRNSSTPACAFFTLRSGETGTALAAEVCKDGRLRVIHRNPPGSGGGFDLFSQTNMNDGEWHHVAVVRDDDKKLHLFIDGSLEASSKEAVVDFGDTPYPLYLGVNIEKHPRYFKGLMDEVRFWNGARTREEIISGMNSPVDPASPRLVAAYGFNQPAVLTPSHLPAININLHSIIKEALELPHVTQ